MATPTTLYEFYTGKGQILPSLTERAQLYQQYGLGSSSSYVGSAPQNTALLAKLLAGGSQNVFGNPPVGNVGEIGTWIDSTTGQGYSGPKKNANDQPASPTTGQPITPTPPNPPPPTSTTPRLVYRVDRETGHVSGPYDAADAPDGLPGDEATKLSLSIINKTNVPSTTSTPIPETTTGDPTYDNLLQTLQEYLDKLINQGKTVNSAVEITPEKAAEFLKQAETEIDPYYSSQLKISRDALLRSADYTTEDIRSFESDLERKYGKSLTQLGEAKAEQGLALSGGRIREERELAEDTQRAVEENRRNVSFEAANQAAQFAQSWGTQNLATPTIGMTPLVRPGEKMFKKPEGVSNLYTLNPDVYSNLKGQQQYEQEVAKRSRVAELESAFRTKEENKLRSLML